MESLRPLTSLPSSVSNTIVQAHMQDLLQRDSALTLRADALRRSIATIVDATLGPQCEMALQESRQFYRISPEECGSKESTIHVLQNALVRIVEEIDLLYSEKQQLAFGDIVTFHDLPKETIETIMLQADLPTRTTAAGTSKMMKTLALSASTLMSSRLVKAIHQSFFQTLAASNTSNLWITECLGKLERLDVDSVVLSTNFDMLRLSLKTVCDEIEQAVRKAPPEVGHVCDLILKEILEERKREHSEASVFFSHMLDRLDIQQIELIPERYHRSTAVGILTEALVRKGHYQQALDLSERILPISESFLVRIARAFAEKEQFEKAKAVSQRITHDLLQQHAWEIIIGIMAEQERSDRIQDLIGRHPPLKVLCIIAITLAEKGLFEEAIAFTQQIKNELLKNDILRRISESREFHTLWERRDALRPLLSPTTIELLVAQGRNDNARELALTNPNLFWKAELTKALVEALVVRGQCEQAKPIAEGLVIACHRCDAINSIISALVTKGRYDQAEYMTEELTDNYLRFQALATIAKALVLVGIFDRALAVTERLPEGLLRSETLSTLARAMAKKGQAEPARALALTISNELMRSYTFNSPEFNRPSLDM